MRGWLFLSVLFENFYVTEVPIEILENITFLFGENDSLRRFLLAIHMQESFYTKVDLHEMHAISDAL